MHFVKKLAVVAATISALVWTAPVFAHGTVNISVWTSTVNQDFVSEVEILGPGGGVFAFADPVLVADLTNPDTALADALAGLGLAPDTALGNVVSLLLDTLYDFDETVISPYNPVDNPDIVGGHPTDWSTWIAFTDVSIDVEVFLVSTYSHFHRLTASILQVTDVPAPAAGLLFVGALFGLGAMRARRHS